jgi:hypothetical protein
LITNEDKEGFYESIEFIAGLVKATVDYMEVAETKLAKVAETKLAQVADNLAQAVAGPQVLGRKLLKRQVVNRY